MSLVIFRQFIPKYAQRVRSLNLLTSGRNASKKNIMVDWDHKCQQAFDKFKELCTNTVGIWRLQ